MTVQLDEHGKLMEELRTRAPRNAIELNIWLRMHFQVFEAPSRAYFDLPIDEARVERRTHVVAAWLGPEEGCVDSARECFTTIYKSLDEFADAGAVLFIRRWAEYEPPHYEDHSWDSGEAKPKWVMVPGRLTIRFALWDLDMMSHIGAIFPVKAEYPRR